MTRERMFGVGGLAVLLGVFIVIVAMIAGGGGEEDLELATATPTPTGTPTQTATPKPSPTPPPLTAEQKAQRDAAVTILQSRGFKPVKLRTYRGDHTLRVLIGKPAGGGKGGRMAFFFAEDRYIGNDSPETSYRLSVAKQSDLRTTLRYGVFSPGDEACCPSETRTVRFFWDGTNLQPLELVPDAARRAGPVQ